METDGPVTMSYREEAKASGKGRMKITHKVEIGVADLKGGEPVESD